MKRKRTLLHGTFITLFFAALIALTAACLSPDFVRELVPGSYEGKGQGYRGQIVVRLQLSSAGIEDIVIVSHREGTHTGLSAMETLLELVLEHGSTDLDVITGASFSSRGFLEAVENALEKAAKPR